MQDRIKERDQHTNDHCTFQPNIEKKPPPRNFDPKTVVARLSDPFGSVKSNPNKNREIEENDVNNYIGKHLSERDQGYIGWR